MRALFTFVLFAILSLPVAGQSLYQPEPGLFVSVDAVGAPSVFQDVNGVSQSVGVGYRFGMSVDVHLFLDQRSGETCGPVGACIPGLTTGGLALNVQRPLRRGVVRVTGGLAVGVEDSSAAAYPRDGAGYFREGPSVLYLNPRLDVLWVGQWGDAAFSVRPSIGAFVEQARYAGETTRYGDREVEDAAFSETAAGILAGLPVSIKTVGRQRLVLEPMLRADALSLLAFGSGLFQLRVSYNF